MIQQTLFSGPPQRPQPRSVPPSDPNVIPDDTKRLTGQNAVLLELLKRGPASIDDICRVTGSRKHTSRVSDLRDAGYVIECERVPGGNNVYRLVGGPFPK